MQHVPASMTRQRDSSCTVSFKCTWEIKSVTSSSISSFASSFPIRCCFYVVSRSCSSASVWLFPPSIGPSFSTRVPRSRRLQQLSHCVHPQSKCGAQQTGSFLSGSRLFFTFLMFFPYFVFLFFFGEGGETVFLFLVLLFVLLFASCLSPLRGPPSARTALPVGGSSCSDVVPLQPPKNI